MRLLLSIEFTFYINLYNRIYNDYKDSKSEVTDSAYDMEKQQHHFLLTQSMYSYWQNIVTAALAPRFDKEIYPDYDYQIENEDGEIVELKAERYTYFW